MTSEGVPASGFGIERCSNPDLAGDITHDHTTRCADDAGVRIAERSGEPTTLARVTPRRLYLLPAQRSPSLPFANARRIVCGALRRGPPPLRFTHAAEDLLHRFSSEDGNALEEICRHRRPSSSLLARRENWTHVCARWEGTRHVPDAQELRETSHRYLRASPRAGARNALGYANPFETRPGEFAGLLT